MKKVLLIMAAALMTMTQCRKQETSPATPSADTIKMTITAGPGAKTNIYDNGAITWSEGDVLYVSDGTNWLGSLTLQSGAGNASGTFKGTIQGIGDGEKTCHFFYLGHDNDMTGATGTTNAVISFASQDGSKDDALKYHLGHGSADVTVSGGVATGAVAMRTEIAMAHLKLKMDDADYTGSVTMDVSNTMTVNPNGTFSGSGEGITIGNNGGTSGDRYVTLIPTEATSVSFSGSATGSMTFGHGIQANNLYGMAAGIEVTLARVNVTGVSLNKTSLSLDEGKTATLTATVTPDDATDKSVTWSSNNTSVATVDNGVVTAVAAGSATITVTTVDGGKTATCTVTVTKPVFTVGMNGTKPITVEFSKGNLYYDGSSWKFEANQYDYRTYAGNNSCINGSVKTDGTPTGHWGLFCWSTDAKNNNWGMHTKTQLTNGYTNGNFKDWGGNAIGSDPANTWRTLRHAEWMYLLNTGGSSGRTDANRFAKANVKGVNGLLIFPDGYNNGTAIGAITGVAALNTTDAAYPTESIPGETWTSMESAGVVFLPATGNRVGMGVYSVGSLGRYWSSAYNAEDNAYSMYFASVGMGTTTFNRQNGFSVRLVRSAS